MADEFAPPSGDPADNDSLVGTLRLALEKQAQQTDDMLPCVVIAVERGPPTRVTVQPQIMMGTTDGKKVRRAQIASVPALTLGGGGFLMSFPIAAGDLGWIKASDRDLSLFWQANHAEEWPNTRRMHSFEDGLFIPDYMRAWTLNGADTNRLVIQSMDGATRIAIGPGIIEMTATLVQINGALTVTGHVTGAGKVLDTHTHGGVTVGGGVTGAPS